MRGCELCGVISSGAVGVPYSLRPGQPSTGPLEEGVDVEVALETSFTSAGQEATLEVSSFYTSEFRTDFFPL